jgi:DNA helicase-2/ATP-dependent DNA helicase PcrA
MPFVADLHVHSRYSRACSRDCDLEHLAWWAARKGIGLVGTGDLCHPAWAEEIRTKLVPAEPGLFRLRPDLERDVLATLPGSVRTPVRFQLSVEISTIYKRGEKTRKVHHLLYAPDLGVAGELTRRLARIGNLGSDGRPILGLDSRDLLETLLDSGAGGYLVPAHVWTPWFAALGSKSGFDSVSDCYADLAGHIFAIETGLSSDPSMNHRVSSLDRYRLVSNSDAHSPPALGREATVLSCELSYEGVRRALETGAGLDGTIEFFPEEGKYHLDGHRTCEVRLEPAETRSRDGRCPVCAKPVTVGVLHRVEVLADRPAGYVPAGAPGWRCLVQLPQVVGELLGVGSKSKSVEAEVARMVDRLGPELSILQDVPLDAAAAVGPPGIDEALRRLRSGEVVLAGGYDGEYGVVRLFEPKELADLHPSAAEALFDLPTPHTPAVRPAAAPAEPPATAGEPDGLFVAPAPVVRVVPAPEPAAVSVLDGLDDEQRAAAEAPGPLLVVAGPGTGKTRTLTTRIAYQVGERGVPATEHLALTFTRRAAGELTERLAALLPAPPLVTTFHGLGLRIIREQAGRLGLGDDVRVVDEAERLALAREAMGADAPAREVRRLLDHVSALARDPAAHDPDLAGPLARYRAGKRARGLVDLDDLLVRPVALLTEDPELAEAYRRRWRHVSVDEYQDVDPAQYAMLRLLVPPDGDLCVIGDPDQAIYSFRGAEVGFFLRFADDFPAAREVRLTRNYRSTATVVDAALGLVAPDTLVPGRTLTAAAPGNGPDRVTLHSAADEAAEAAFVVGTIERVLGGSDLTALLRGAADPWTDAVHSYADFAVLYRTDAQAGALVDALEAAGVPYQKRSHHRLGDQPGVRELLAVLREDLVRAAGDPRPVLARVRAAAQAAIDRAGGLPTQGAGSDAELGVDGRYHGLPTVGAGSGAEVGADGRPGGLPALGVGSGAEVGADGRPGGLPALGVGSGAEVGADGWSRLTPASARAAASGRPEADPERRVADLCAALELLTPLAERAGADAEKFLADLALGAEVDLWDPRADRVSLLTLHASKGLEFPVVFVVGCEDGLLPMRFGDEPVGAEDRAAEERRLLFVGMTRARTHLALSGVRRRTVRGRLTEPAPSPYLADLPAHLVERTTRPERRRTVQLRLL